MKKSLSSVCALLALCAVLPLGGCKKKEAAAPQDAFVPRYGKDTAGTVYVAGHYKNFEALEAEFDRFKEYYPEVELRFEYLDKYNSTVLSALKGDNPPDIYFTFSWMLDKDEYRPLFDSAENLASPELGIRLDCIQSGTIVQGKESGRILMIPIMTNSYGMLVNEKLFKEEDLSVPRTYGELKDCVRTFKERGYASPVIGDVTNELGIYASLSVPYFCSTVKGDTAAIKTLNELGPGAGEYAEEVLAFAEEFANLGAVDREACKDLKDINGLVFRFFEGDIPMVFCNADTISSTKKRERISEPFMNAPFDYSAYPIPTDRGTLFYKSVSIELSVYKDSRNLAMANEFLRFLISTEELNNLAAQKRLLTVTGDYRADKIYTAFAEADETINFDILGLMDAPMIQMRRAFNAVSRGEMSKEEALERFGTF